MPLFLKKRKDRENLKDSAGSEEAQDRTGERAADTAMEDNTATSAISERVRFCCDISRAHRRMLKVYAAQQGMALNHALEGLIECHCNS
jgi:hypothetical protein